VASFPGKFDANHRRRSNCFHDANIQVCGFQMRALFDVQFDKGVDFETRRFPVCSVGVFL
jgi:ribosomal protein S27AE